MVSSQTYATANEIFDELDQTKRDDAPVVARIAKAVSRWIDGYCNRQDYGFIALTSATANVYSGAGKAWLYLPDFVELTTVKMKTSISQTTYDFTFDSADIIPFRGDVRNPQYNKLPYHAIMININASYTHFTDGNRLSTRNRAIVLPDSDNQLPAIPTIEVTAKWGYSVVVPDIIKQVCIIESARIYKQSRAGYGDASLNQELGQTNFVKALHPTAKKMLDNSRMRQTTIQGIRR